MHSGPALVVSRTDQVFEFYESTKAREVYGGVHSMSETI
jgi:hypothetical protein